MSIVGILSIGPINIVVVDEDPVTVAVDGGKGDVIYFIDDVTPTNNAEFTKLSDGLNTDVKKLSV